MPRYAYSLSLLALWFLLGCGGSGNTDTQDARPLRSPADLAPEREQHPFAAPLETAHGYAAWQDADALRYELALRVGEKTLLAQVTMETDFSRIKLITDQRESLVWDEKHYYVSPADVAWMQPRLDLFTWPFLTAAPFKINDPGTQVDSLGERQLLDQRVEGIRLSFEADAIYPQSEFQLYRSDSSNLLAGVVFSAPYFAEDDSLYAMQPQAITFHLYSEFDGLQMPTEWRFWAWDEEQGLGERLGTARLGKFKLIETDKLSYSVPFSHRTYHPQGEPVD